TGSGGPSTASDGLSNGSGGPKTGRTEGAKTDSTAGPAVEATAGSPGDPVPKGASSAASSSTGVDTRRHRSEPTRGRARGMGGVPQRPEGGDGGQPEGPAEVVGVEVVVRAKRGLFRPAHVGRVAQPQDEGHRPDGRDEGADRTDGHGHRQVAHGPALEPDDHR